jgi:gamma-polyglutamate biosynthesis protein CapA
MKFSMNKEPESIKISLVGDLMPADTTYTLGNGIGSNMSRLTEHYSREENNPFTGSDIVFCNLESPLISNAGIKKQPFAGNPAVVQLMKILGINVVSVANNHLADHGPESISQTINLLDENAILTTGLKQNEISKIAWVERKGKKFAFAAFNSVEDHPEDMLIAPLGWELLSNTLKEIKKQSPDYTIFSFHWGNEYVNFPSPSQVSLAHELINNGVNVIVGHHPHVVQPIEIYNGGIIIYSLGNFLFDSFWSENVRNGMQVDLVFNEGKTIVYTVKPFRIKEDYTQDYSKTEEVISMLAKAGKTMKLLQTASPVVYQETYLKESNRQRSKARFKMKIYLLKNIFRLSYYSRALFFRNIRMKSAILWKRN